MNAAKLVVQPGGRAARRIGAGALSALLAGCVVVPQTREVYDPECRVLRREMTLETSKVAGMRECDGDACAALLVATGAVTAASAIVSGSIALAGSVVYWFERQGQCNPAAPAPAASAASPAK